MSEHTPVPWEIQRQTHPEKEYESVWISAPFGNEICVMRYAIGCRDANARLIAAAPEMLEALKGFQEWWDEWYRNPNPTTVSDPPIDQARATIIRAEEG